jgi:hypothetical protein
MEFFKTFGRIPWARDRPIARLLLTQDSTTQQNSDMHRAGFEPQIPSFERFKTIRPLNRDLSAIGAGIAHWYSARLRSGWSGVRYCVQIGSGAHPASYPVISGALSLGVKRPGCDADHLPPSSAEVKNAWIYTSILPIRLHGVVLSCEAHRRLQLYFSTSVISFL